MRLFGALISLKENEVRRRPHYLALMAANGVLGGDLLRVEYPNGSPEFTAAVYDEKRKEWSEPESFSALRVLAFSQDGKRSMILLNLSVDKTLPLKLEFSGTVRSGRADWTLLRSESLDDNNERESGEPAVKLEKGQIDDFHSGRVIPLPPGSLTTLQWEE